MISFLANPLRFKKFANIASPLFGIAALVCILIGIWLGIWNSPEDYQQGHSVRVMYVHVPAAMVSMMAYAVMAGASLIAFIWRHPLADELARSCALPGLAFTALTLLTGSLWGKVTWGTYWQWDGRMTSYLLLLFLYIGYLSIWNVISDPKRAARIAGLVAMVGSINLPIIKYSVDWWSSLHQSSTISLAGASAPMEMLAPLFIMIFGYSFFFGWLILNRVQNAIGRAKFQRSKIKSSPVATTLEKL
jgi:heme exporter protein C